MYVHTDRYNLQSIKLPEMDERVAFSDNNVAQCKQSDGEILVNEIDHITEKDNS